MPHRGRLNVLAHVLQKPLSVIFAEFQGIQPSEFKKKDWKQSFTGDVKYHLGTSIEKEYGDKKVLLTLLANPSHLEHVNPVVMGKARAW